jgi:hypothetical protein
MRPFAKLVFALLAAASLGACTHSIHLVHVSDFDPYDPKSGGKMVEGRAEQFVILWFEDDTNYVDRALDQLMKSCPRGRIQGITTQYSTSHGFFSWTNKILMRGLCVRA